jgi:hypothetical protein
MGVCIETLGGGIIERLELVILTGREAVVIFLYMSKQYVS